MIEPICRKSFKKRLCETDTTARFKVTSFMSLLEYQRKRRFGITPEPSGKKRVTPAQGRGLIYVVQKHKASHLHYDFRIQWNGVLLSWAVPKGPSLDPSMKRLATRVEDHPIDYASFEGVIPQNEYGAGTVMVWDKGIWAPESREVDAALRKGELKFTLRGKKLKGSWVLVRIRAFGKKPSQSSWLLIKHRDRYALTKDVTKSEPYSATSHRLLVDIARDEGGDVKRAGTGDPAAIRHRLRKR